MRHSNVKIYQLVPKRHVDIKGSGRLFKIPIFMKPLFWTSLSFCCESETFKTVSFVLKSVGYGAVGVEIASYDSYGGGGIEGGGWFTGFLKDPANGINSSWSSLLSIFSPCKAFEEKISICFMTIKFKRRQPTQTSHRIQVSDNLNNFENA